MWSRSWPRGTTTSHRRVVPAVRFRLAGNAVHACHRLDGVVAHGGLAGKHYRIGAVKDRVGHVAGLGPGRPGVGPHRVEHVGRGHDRLAGRPRRRDQPFLHVGHLFQRDFHAQVAAGHHDPVERLDDLGARLTASGRSILASSGASTLSMRAAPRSSWAAPGSRTNDSASQSTPASAATTRASRSRLVTAGMDRGVSGKLMPLLGRRVPPTSTRKRTLWRSQWTARICTRPSSSSTRCPARSSWIGWRLRDVDVGGNGSHGGHDDFLACGERHGARQEAAQLRARQVGEHGQRARPAGRELAEALDAAQVLVGRAVREVDAGHVEPGFQDGFQDAGSIGGRPQGGHDPGAPLHELLLHVRELRPPPFRRGIHHAHGERLTRFYTIGGQLFSGGSQNRAVR